MKFLGACLILISGSMIGWLNAQEYLLRVKHLKQLQLALNLFNTEISYSQTVLARAFTVIADNVEYPIAEIFEQSASKLSRQTELTFPQLWQQILQSTTSIHALTQEDIKIMLEWGQQVGNSSLEEQKKINQLTLERIKQNEELAKNTADKRVKLSKYAGVLISMLVIILFY